MTPLDWTDVLDIGLPVIDEQHKQLFAISNDLLSAMEKGEGEAILSDIFTRLRKYTEYHFSEEEAFMQKIGYPDFQEHAAEHSKLLVRVNVLRKTLLESGDITPDQAADFISDWIIGHIMHRDSEVGTYAKAQEEQA